MTSSDLQSASGKPTKTISVVMLAANVAIASLALLGDVAAEWHENYRIPTEEITPVVESLKVHPGLDGNLYFIGPGFVEGRDKTGKRIWRHVVGGEKGWLGILLENTGAVGVLIKNIIDWPARRAGLQIGDIITRIGKQETPTTTELIKAVKELPPATTLEIEFIRGKEPARNEVKLGARKRARRFLGEDAANIYVSFDYQVIAINKISGKPTWDIRLEPPPEATAEVILASYTWVPGLDWDEGIMGLGTFENRLILVLGGHRLMGVNVSTGQPQWSYDSRIPMVDAPALVNGRVAFMTEVGNAVRFINPASGALIEKSVIPEENAVSVFQQMYALGKAVVLKGKRVHIIPNGAPVWTGPFSDGVIAHVANRWVLAADNGLLTSVDANTRKELWKRQTGNTVALASDEKFVVVRTENELLILESAGGKTLELRKEAERIELVQGNDSVWLHYTNEDPNVGETKLERVAQPAEQSLTFRGRVFLLQPLRHGLVAATANELVVLSSVND